MHKEPSVFFGRIDKFGSTIFLSFFGLMNEEQMFFFVLPGGQFKCLLSL
jgi:hypothetical protein